MDTPWTSVRTVTTQAAEGASAPTSLVALANPARKVEVRLRSGVVGGAPTSVTLGVWRGSQGSVDKMGTVTLQGSSIAVPQPAFLDFYGQNVWVTVESFSGGTTPTLSGTIEARAVFGG